MEEKFLEQELSYQLVGCFYRVRNIYRSGHREIFYDRVLDEVLAGGELILLINLALRSTRYKLVTSFLLLFRIS